MKTCDIIIPTYNGREKLSKYVLPALRAQEIPDGWNVRVVICDDGSDAPAIARGTWSAPWRLPLVLRLPHRGRAATRNSGIDASNADIILFLGDDIVLRNGSLASHLKFHERNADTTKGALGCIIWDPTISPTPFMEWMMHGGQQNDYDSIVGERECDPTHYFYGSFVSVKRESVGNERFSEAFDAYGWEDLEFGERMRIKGMKLTVLHDALALHRHMYAASVILERQRLVGAGVTRMNTSLTRRIKHGIYQFSGMRMMSATILKKYGNRLNFPRFFAFVTAGEFWYGLHSRESMLISQRKISTK
jgi:glycosyltransferase involved in cell wall biosynthesis